MTLSVDHSRAGLIGDALSQFGELRIRVTGSSMLPSIFPGDVLTIVRSSIDEVRRGDVVLFSRGGRLFAHRAVAHNGDRLITHGDSVPSPDAPVSQAEVLGIAVRLERRGKPMIVASRVSVPARFTATLLRRSSRASALLQRMRILRGSLSEAATT